MTTNDGRGWMAPASVLGACVALGLIAGGWLLGAEIRSMKFADRSVDVKGLVERTVKADQGTWALGFKTAGSDLPGTFARSEADKAAVLQFLTANGFLSSEITAGDISVNDKATSGNWDEKGDRYILEQTVSVQTKDVDKLALAGQKTANLVRSGVILTSNSNIAYKFTGLNALKPDMITEATRNARSAADRFAADSGSGVGEIRTATQGTFSITADSPASANDEDGPVYGGDANADASIMKRVRVVVSIEYYLK